MKPDLISHLEVIRPEGTGPFPVVVMMHGCGGLRAKYRRYAEDARQAGVAAVILDSFGPRGVSRAEAVATVCTGLRLRGKERSADLVAALRWLDAQPWADRELRAVAGWSHGGWSAMEAFAAASPDPVMSRLKLAVLVYPYAGPLSRTTQHGWGPHRPRVLACLAGRDTVVGTVAPRRAIERLRADGLSLDLLHLPDAPHCFDDDQDPLGRYRADCEARLRERFAPALVSALSPCCEALGERRAL